jgi:hypothetical protein
MNNAVRIAYYTSNFSSGRTTQTVVIQRGKKILAKATAPTFKAALKAARAAR